MNVNKFYVVRDSDEKRVYKFIFTMTWIIMILVVGILLFVM